MSAKRLTITDATGNLRGFSCNVRYEKLDRDDLPEIEHRVGDIIVKNRSIHDGVILLEGMIQKVWCDEKGTIYEKDQVKHYYEGNEVTEKSQSKTFEIIGYQPVSSYTDSYVISKYYEIFPDDEGYTKDFDRERAKSKNLVVMRTLFEYLQTNKVVGRAECNVSSAGFVSSDGYIRAISFGNLWGLEVGIFKETKVFKHLNEKRIPQEENMEARKISGIKRI